MATGRSQARDLLRWPMLLSLLVHGAVLSVLLLVPHAEVPKREYVPVRLEVRPRLPPAPVSAPPVVPAAAIHPPLRHPRPAVSRPRGSRRPPKASPPEPRAAASSPEVSLPSAPLVAGVPAPEPELEGLATPAGDPHGAPHGHPHGVAPEIPTVEPPPHPPPKPPAELQVRRVAPSGPVPLRDLSRRPRPIEIVKARYPDAARRAGIEGAVLLEILVDENGRVREAKVRKGLGLGCDEAASAALLASRFEPAVDRDGRPVATRFKFRYNFELE